MVQEAGFREPGSLRLGKIEDGSSIALFYHSLGQCLLQLTGLMAAVQCYGVYELRSTRF